VGKLSQAHQVGGFVSGLKESIRIDVQAVKPSTLTAVVGLAKLYEACVLAKKKAHLHAGQQTKIFSNIKLWFYPRVSQQQPTHTKIE
jgi:hypothetical protein